MRAMGVTWQRKTGKTNMNCLMTLCNKKKGVFSQNAIHHVAPKSIRPLAEHQFPNILN
jgi:hypothetical protein